MNPCIPFIMMSIYGLKRDIQPMSQQYSPITAHEATAIISNIGNIVLLHRTTHKAYFWYEPLNSPVIMLIG